MLRTWQTRLHEDEDGFTLIELMVVVLILAILIVMGLPTFIGVRARFQNRAAQSDLRNVVLAARILYTDNATFTSADDSANGHRHDHPRDVLRANRSASIATNPVAPAVHQRHRHRIDQRGLDGDAVLSGSDVGVGHVLRDPRRHDRDQIRDDGDGGELHGDVGSSQRGRDVSRRRRLVAMSVVRLPVPR